jgi:hypothetical protein
VHFAFTDDQVAFRDAVRELLANECPASAVRRAWESATGRTDAVWAHLSPPVGSASPTSISS